MTNSLPSPIPIIPCHFDFGKLLNKTTFGVDGLVNLFTSCVKVLLWRNIFNNNWKHGVI